MFFASLPTRESTASRREAKSDAKRRGPLDTRITRADLRVADSDGNTNNASRWLRRTPISDAATRSMVSGVGGDGKSREREPRRRWDDARWHSVNAHSKTPSVSLSKAPKRVGHGTAIGRTTQALMLVAFVLPIMNLCVGCVLSSRATLHDNGKEATSMTDLAVIRISRLEEFLRGIDGAIAARRNGGSKTELEHLEDARRAIEALVEEVDGSPQDVRWCVTPRSKSTQQIDRVAAAAKRNSTRKVTGGNHPAYGRARAQVEAVFQNGATYPSNVAVARATGLHETTARKHLADLQSEGVIEKVGGVWRRRGGA
jgi:hypothetical protein